MAIPNYVKFQRGTITSYNNLHTKDNNTLYFVYENNDDTKGKLYLGTRLISNTVGEGGVNTLGELTDVIISGAGAGSFLVLNSEGKWTAISANDVAQTIINGGGNFVIIDDNEFNFNSVNGKLELKGYQNAEIGMMPVKTTNGLSWQAAPIDLSTRVGSLEDSVSTLEINMAAVDGKISTAIANSSHLKYQIIDDLSQATEENVIYLYTNNSNDNNNRYDEYMLVNHVLEKIGSLNIDLSNYVTSEELNNAIETAISTKANSSDVIALETRVGNLENAFQDLEQDFVTLSHFNTVVGDLSELNNYNDLNMQNMTISDTLVDIYERLMWVELSE